MNRTSRRNKDIAIAVLRGATYLKVAIEYDITWERAFQITRKLCLQVEPTSKQEIKAFRNRANEFIQKIEAIPEVEAPGSPRYIWKQGRHLQ
jgi:hypothetical protein